MKFPPVKWLFIIWAILTVAALITIPISYVCYYQSLVTLHLMKIGYYSSGEMGMVIYALYTTVTLITVVIGIFAVTGAWVALAAGVYRGLWKIMGAPVE